MPNHKWHCSHGDTIEAAYHSIPMTLGTGHWNFFCFNCIRLHGTLLNQGWNTLCSGSVWGAESWVKCGFSFTRVLICFCSCFKIVTLNSFLLQTLLLKASSLSETEAIVDNSLVIQYLISHFPPLHPPGKVKWSLQCRSGNFPQSWTNRWNCQVLKLLLSFSKNVHKNAGLLA